MISTQFDVAPSVTKENNGVELYRNSPNPFIEMTLLWFRLPAAANVVLRFFDSIGREVVSKSGNFQVGENHLVLHRADLREPGMYTCRLETPFGTASHKLMMY
ncbi:MAG: T9SS type A sorting domain-containing protein [Saprospiraceae bacterium]|nr:T9SS type A sorting domain-containing protein [Saprospiraceae bacterium]